MEPILLIHGYSSEGKENTVEEIYGTLPNDLRDMFGDDAVVELNLSRWISLNDGISLDDVSFAMERALQTEYAELLQSGFHVVIHSTGALVVRNWISLFSPKPSPIKNLIHLAGANFGSGLAHIGRGQLARWGRLIFGDTGRGMKVLNELEFGAWKTLNMHLEFLLPGNDMYDDFKVQEFCMNGSQTLSYLRPIPIRYVKEDSADNTVRTSACNLNFNYIQVTPSENAFSLTLEQLDTIVEQRQENWIIEENYYDYDLSHLSQTRRTVPFAVIYETAHFGSDIGIVSGRDNRQAVLPLIKSALTTPYDVDAYQQRVEQFNLAHTETFERAKVLDPSLFEWNKQSQYEGHAQLIFRLTDQFGNGVENFDVTFKTSEFKNRQPRLEKMIEDQHGNRRDKGTITFYLRTQKFLKGSKRWRELMNSIADVDIEVTGYEPLSGDISYLPLNIHLTGKQLRRIIQSFRTTIIDIELVRLPSENVFNIKRMVQD
ncbi:MAG: hypothetical protein OQK78_08635 [Gammaproteobacteria bacterium]|nr:hypothetical protein [Gammaproteobacteria bacterium]